MTERPKVRVVTGVLRNFYGEFFLGRRVGRAYQGCWETPGGKVDPGETDENALAREWLEELGIGVNVGRQVFEGEFTTRDLVGFTMHAYEVYPIGISWAALDYRMNGGAMGDSHDLVRWVSRTEILELPESERVPSLWPIVQGQDPVPVTPVILEGMPTGDDSLEWSGGRVTW